MHATIHRVHEPGPKRSYSRSEVCRLLGLRHGVLESWEKHGFVAKAETYAFRDLVALKALRQLRRNRYSAEKIKLVLASLRKRLSAIQNPLTELNIYTDGRRLAVQVDGQKMEAMSGQLLLNFDQQEIKRLLTFPGQRAEETLAEEMAQRQREAKRWFDQGIELEQSGAPPARVIEAYQKALEYDGDAAGALVNLGTIYYHQSKWKEAEERYLRAIEARPSYALAHFNLGNLYDELGQWTRALECYLTALRLDADYADAHYNLALLYQNQGEPLKAVKHWREYLRIDPVSEWAGVAKRELSRLRQLAVVKGAGNGG